MSPAAPAATLFGMHVPPQHRQGHAPEHAEVSTQGRVVSSIDSSPRQTGQRHSLRAAFGTAVDPVAQLQRVGTVTVEPEETYLYDATRDESFAIRGGGAMALAHGTQLSYVVFRNAPDVAVICRLHTAGDSAIATAVDNNQELGRFRVQNRADVKGGHQYLTHMFVLTPLKGQGLGKDLMRLCLATFGNFLVGTPPVMGFLQPVDPNDDIELTDEGDSFIQLMMQQGILNLAHVFPTQYTEEVRVWLDQQQQSDEDGAGQ